MFWADDLDASRLLVYTDYLCVKYLHTSINLLENRI